MSHAAAGAGRYFIAATRHALAATLLLALAVAVLPQAAAANPKLGAIVIDARTGAVLHEYAPDRKLYPASLTKVMTLYLTFEALAEGRLKLGDRLEFSAFAAARAPSKLGLPAGATISVEEAILALVTKSANDVATVVAEGIGGTEARFAQMMTRKARDLGMRRTTFRNASGLPDAAQISTPRDMSILAIAVRRDFPQFYHYFSTDAFSFNGQVYRNHNRLLGSYDGVDGIKTGYTVASGFNLISAVERDGVRLIGVVFGGRTARSRDDSMRDLLDRSYARATAVAAARARQPEEPVLRPDVQLARAAVPAAAEVGDAPLSPWAIQVGAFRDYDAASRRAEAASRLIDTRPERLTLAISPNGNGERPLYRVRFFGLADEREARSVCDRLQRERIGCLPVAPSPT